MTTVGSQGSSDVAAAQGSPDVAPTGAVARPRISFRVILAGIAATLAVLGTLLGVFDQALSVVGRVFGQDGEPVPAAPVAPVAPEAAPAPIVPTAPEASAAAPAVPAPAPLAPAVPRGTNFGPAGSPSLGVPVPAPARVVVGDPVAPDAPVPAVTPSDRFLTDLDMTASGTPGFAAQQPVTCTTGGRTFDHSLLLSVPAGDPAEGSYVRADYQVPPGLLRMTATVGLVDDTPDPRHQITVFVQSGPDKVYQEVIPYGSTSPISLAIKPGQRLRIQASASGYRRVCVGDIRLAPTP